MMRQDRTLAKKWLKLRGTDLLCLSFKNRNKQIFMHTLVGCHIEKSEPELIKKDKDTSSLQSESDSIKMYKIMIKLSAE
jgi:hypothetical protein